MSHTTVETEKFTKRHNLLHRGAGFAQTWVWTPLKLWCPIKFFHSNQEHLGLWESSGTSGWGNPREVGRRQRKEKRPVGILDLSVLQRLRKERSEPLGPCTEGTASVGGNPRSINSRPPGRVGFLRSSMTSGSEKGDEGGTSHCLSPISCVPLSYRACRGKQWTWQDSLATTNRRWTLSTQLHRPLLRRKTPWKAVCVDRFIYQSSNKRWRLEM